MPTTIRNLSFLLFLLASLGSNSLSARPVPFQGAWNLMAEYERMDRHIMASYAVTRDWAPGFMLMRTNEGSSKINVGTFDLNYLAYRKNAPDYQANVFLTAGAGVFDDGDESVAGGRFTVNADIEDRRRYLAGSYSAIAAPSMLYRHKFVGRVGWAPYEAGFDEVNTWLILQAQYETRSSKELIVRPIVRVFYRTVLAEFGSSFDGEIYARLNLQFRF